MNTIQFSLPENATISGELLDDYSNHPARLPKDIIKITLANEVIVDIRWYPWYTTFWPNGQFSINVLYRNWNNLLLARAINARTPVAAAKIAEGLAKVYSDTEWPDLFYFM